MWHWTNTQQRHNTDKDLPFPIYLANQCQPQMVHLMTDCWLCWFMTLLSAATFTYISTNTTLTFRGLTFMIIVPCIHYLWSIRFELVVYIPCFFFVYCALIASRSLSNRQMLCFVYMVAQLHRFVFTRPKPDERAAGHMLARVWVSVVNRVPHHVMVGPKNVVSLRETRNLTDELCSRYTIGKWQRVFGHLKHYLLTARSD